MPIWRCPHCGTPQAESSRCWVCRRSTTSCETCRHFRRGIASGLGVCGLDPRHPALNGAEMRACWVALDAAHEISPTGLAVTTGSAAGTRPDPGLTPRRTFVPVDEVDRLADPREPRPGAPPAARVSATVAPALPAAGGWSLWGDAEP